jgi:hypothetical protein
MVRLLKYTLVLSASCITMVGLQAAPAHAATAARQSAKIVGQLGIEGGAFPGRFQPTAGTVQVEFNIVPLILQKHVGKSGNFHINLSPGSYTVTGCGPKKSRNQCSQPQNITLTAGEVDHIRLVWEFVP